MSGGDAGSGGTGGSGGSASGNTPRDFFMNVVYPAMLAQPDGCDACHNLGGSADLPFMGNPKGAPEPYDAMTTWPGIVVKDPKKSIVVVHPAMDSHGAGQAPTISDSLRSKILEWLDMEADNLPDPQGGVVYQVAPFKPILGGALNQVYLDDLDASLTYASITFNAKELAEDLLQIKNLEIHPVEGQSIHIIHPLFTVYPQKSEADPDPVDSFSGVDQIFTLDTGEVVLGTGELILTNWRKEAYLGIAFEMIKNEGGGGVASGCKDVAMFQEKVVPQMKVCADMCHGGTNVQANATMDLSKLNDNPPDAACAQVRARITPGDPAISSIITQTDPLNQAVHMYKFMGNKNKYAAFKDAVSPWIISEAQ